MFFGLFLFYYVTLFGLMFRGINYMTRKKNVLRPKIVCKTLSGTPRPNVICPQRF